MRQNQPMPTRVAVIQPKPRQECWLDGCHAEGEHHIVANAYLCLEHFLRDAVRRNNDER